MFRSPSTRREWIEIRCTVRVCSQQQRSPSTRREWIEIKTVDDMHTTVTTSPSTRREWIEIPVMLRLKASYIVSLHPEGVD